jgi:glyoxylase-like metal-dependent hydrolase (beta-lactamase superfamily II)
MGASLATPILEGRAYCLDLRFQGRPEAIAAFLLPGPAGRFALIECGPESCLPALELALAEAGCALAGLEAVAVTHVHLDHAGAAGLLARRTGATILVHPRGAPHLLEPSKLWDSAGRLYQDRMVELWGGITPVPPDRLRVVRDGELFELAGWEIQAIDTPGHAFHHHAYRTDAGELFCGDAAGIRLPGVAYVQPPTPPPELHVESWLATIDRMAGLLPARICLTHFGEIDRDLPAHFEQLRLRLKDWGERILAWTRAGLSDAVQLEHLQALVARELEGAGLTAELALRYSESSSLPLNLLGYRRYWSKIHPERLSG